MTYYRIRNKKTGLYLNGLRRENPIGRFYTSLKAVNRAFAASFADRGDYLVRLKRYLAKLEIVPVKLTEGKPTSPAACKSVARLSFPPKPKYIALRRVGTAYDHEWYEIDGKPYAIRAEWKDGAWFYNLHLGHVHAAFKGFHGDTVGPYLLGAYTAEKRVREDELSLGPKLTSMAQVLALKTPQETTLRVHTCQYLRFPIPRASR
jgi:hypothetical protein